MSKPSSALQRLLESLPAENAGVEGTPVTWGLLRKTIQYALSEQIDWEYYEYMGEDQ